jgi:ATP-dependent helicase/nuclease subunit A
LSYESDNIPTLQGFVFWIENFEITVKRELEEAGGHVRIMTVHGSKGLQAPIVFLPDTIRSPSAKKTARLLWPDKTGLPLPLWSPNKNADSSFYLEAKDRYENHMEEEYKRLLYVAMTRAEDRLYICGTKGKTKPLENSWYHFIYNALSQMNNVSTVEMGERGEKLLLYQPQSRKVESESKEHSAKQQALGDIKWALEPVKTELHTSRPLTPSRPAEKEPAARSPLAYKDANRFRRGNISHKLLEILPEFSEELREKVALEFVSRPGFDLSKKMQESIVREVLDIVNHQEYKPLFGKGSLAEVPITGLVGENVVSGQIDRLLITEDSVWIVDYKTNRPPPAKPEQVPDIYRKQLLAYRNIISKLYPERAIRTFLLWTDGPIFMEIS